MFWASLTFSLTEALFICPFFVGLSAARHRQKGEQIMDTVMQAPALSMRIGGTTYVIGMHFSEKSKDTLEDKVRKLALQEIKTQAA